MTRRPHPVAAGEGGLATVAFRLYR